MNNAVTRGFTMIEVLVSIVVIGFGLLGVAGLQAFAIKNNMSANQRVTATVLAQDIIDRIHTNAEGVKLGVYNQPDLSAYGTAVANCNTTTGCSPSELAQNDLYEWQQRVAALLPNGVGLICLTSTPTDATATPAAPLCDGVGSNVYAVKIWWSEDRTATRSSTLYQFAWPFNP